MLGSEQEILCLDVFILNELMGTQRLNNSACFITATKELRLLYSGLIAHEGEEKGTEYGTG